MKKLIVSILAAFLMLGGLVAASATTASAQAKCQAYAGCVKTTTAVAGPHHAKPDHRVKTHVRVRPAAGGNAAPKGSITVTYNPRGKGKTITKVVPYRGTRQSVRSPKLAAGKYTVRVRFTPRKGAAYIGSLSEGFALVVK